MRKYIMASVALSALVAAAPAVASDDDHFKGFYVGINGGYGWVDDDRVGVKFTDNRFTNVGKLDSDGGFGGLQAGYNFRMNSIVLGIEADVQLSDISSSFGPTAITAGPIVGTFDGKSDISAFGTVRGRAGWAMGPALLYATGGFAWANVDYRVRGVDGGGNHFNIHEDKGVSGWVLGAGVEWAISHNWSAKLEYQHIDLGREVLSAPILTPAGANTGIGASTIMTQTFDTVRVGINYKFGHREEHDSLK